ncbi:uncharacterized protein LOC125204931 [Salvia hispanica]|uniref:uncharacterized protein LOC125204931 n=1 Tax=Salvia hispanica TaxID=49212 RepID=UPI0020096781|nr:uncharacterized protein LOC125204931 [Salvia hispanica]
MELAIMYPQAIRASLTCRGTQYTLSESNWLTTIGCDDFGATSIAVGGHYSHDACIGFCSDTSSYVGVCPNNGNINFVGRGCCRVPIPKGLGTSLGLILLLLRFWLHKVFKKRKKESSKKISSNSFFSSINKQVREHLAKPNFSQQTN